LGVRWLSLSFGVRIVCETFKGSTSGGSEYCEYISLNREISFLSLSQNNRFTLCIYYSKYSNNSQPLWTRKSGKLSLPLTSRSYAFGNIAAMPEELIEVRDFGMMQAYLVESRSLGGISGSPVFVHVPA